MPGVKPVTIELTDAKTKKVVDTLEVDAVLVATGRAPYTQVRGPSSLYLWGMHTQQKRNMGRQRARARTRERERERERETGKMPQECQCSGSKCRIGSTGGEWTLFQSLQACHITGGVPSCLREREREAAY